MSLNRTLYKDNIIDHYKNPRNFGSINDADKKVKVANASCGDEIEIFLKVREGIVEDVKFSGSGCAISIASASILYEKIVGKNIDDLKKILPDEVLENVGMTKDSGRVKCGLLSWEALKKALE